MVVIHPYDPSTEDFRHIYDRIVRPCDVVIRDAHPSDEQIRSALKRDCDELIILIGHGCPQGLCCRTSDGGLTIIVGEEYAPILREKRVIGIWCYASEFAKSCRIPGFYTGMFISEMSEAMEWNMFYESDENISYENWRFAERIEQLIMECVPFADYPKRLDEMDDTRSPLTRFNYEQCVCFRDDMETIYYDD